MPEQRYRSFRPTITVFQQAANAH